MRAKRVRLVIKHDCSLVVVLPLFVSLRTAERFLYEKRSWVMRSLEKVKKQEFQPIAKGTKRDYVGLKDKAYNLVLQKLEKFNQIYKFKYKNVRIRNQKTRWGSCSKHGNLNFNYKIVLLPDNLADYLVVHELSHIRELNHSKRFWDLVGQTIPNYRKLQRELKMTKV